LFMWNDKSFCGQWCKDAAHRSSLAGTENDIFDLQSQRPPSPCSPKKRGSSSVFTDNSPTAWYPGSHAHRKEKSRLIASAVAVIGGLLAGLACARRNAACHNAAPPHAEVRRHTTAHVADDQSRDHGTPQVSESVPPATYHVGGVEHTESAKQFQDKEATSNADSQILRHTKSFSRQLSEESTVASSTFSRFQSPESALTREHSGNASDDD